jgi:hypothetical protein
LTSRNEFLRPLHYPARLLLRYLCQRLVITLLAKIKGANAILHSRDNPFFSNCSVHRKPTSLIIVFANKQEADEGIVFQADL